MHAVARVKPDMNAISTVGSGSGRLKSGSEAEEYANLLSVTIIGENSQSHKHKRQQR